MIGGRLGDIFGHELMLKMNMFLFNIFTLVCALVPNKIGLVVARALQGGPLSVITLGHIHLDHR